MGLYSTTQVQEGATLFQVKPALFQGEATLFLDESILFMGKSSGSFSITFRCIPSVFLKMPKKLKMSHFLTLEAKLFKHKIQYKKNQNKKENVSFILATYRDHPLGRSVHP
jgi:hypothetical protein